MTNEWNRPLKAVWRMEQHCWLIQANTMHKPGMRLRGICFCSLTFLLPVESSNPSQELLSPLAAAAADEELVTGEDNVWVQG